MRDYFKLDFGYRWFYSWHTFWYNTCHVFRWLKWCWQRAVRGYGDCDLWCMDSYWAEVTLAMLQRFREHHGAYPGFITPEEWNGLLDEMIEGFEVARRIIESDYDLTTKDWIKQERADRKLFEKKMRIFAKYFFHLWD